MVARFVDLNEDGLLQLERTLYFSIHFEYLDSFNGIVLEKYDIGIFLISIKVRSNIVNAFREIPFHK